MRKNIWQKQIPTLLGIGVLITALIVGVLVFTIGGGPGVFAPRAAPETTPKKIEVTNVTDTSFTVSFYTDSQTAGFVRYGTTADDVKSQASDDRDQLSGSIGNFNLHHITVRGLNPNTTYYYLLGTSARATFDDNGQPFTIKTTQRGGAPAAAKTAYGNVLTGSGAPAEGAVVYVTIDGVGKLSSLVKNSGSWAIPLSNARQVDGSGYANITDAQTVNIVVQGTVENQTAQTSTTVAESQPVETLTLGGSTAQTGTAGNSPTAVAPTTTTTSSDSPTTPTDGEPPVAPANEQTSTSNIGISNTGTTTTLASALSSTSTETSSDTTNSETSTSTTANSASSSALANSSSTQQNSTNSASVVNIDSPTTTTINSQKPTITGQAVPNARITIQVNSTTQINQTITASNNGNFELDLASLGAELEPGEHTVTISYLDPATNQTVTKTKNFTVVAAASTAGSSLTSTSTATNNGSSTESTQQMAAATNQPYGSANPVPVGSQATQSTTTAPTATSSTGKTASSSGGRTSIVATGSAAMPVSGSIGNTVLILAGGLFFLLAGGWSYWIAQQLQTADIPEQIPNSHESDIV